MKTSVSIRQQTNCAQCGASIVRSTWNYGKNRPIARSFCNKACKGAWQREQREALGFTREWLTEQYVTLGRTANDIAAEIQRDAKRVWEWMTDYGISTRPRGYTTEHLPKDGSTFRGRTHTIETRAVLRKIALADGRVPYDPKIGSYMKGRKGANTPAWKGGATPERQAFYSTDVWREAVKAVWKRANACCERCGKRHNSATVRGTFHVHHIISFSIARELRADAGNLALLCKECHRFVHGKRNVAQEFIGELR